MKIDLADVGPGVAWVFEFDEDGRGRPMNDKRSIDLMHGRRFVWAHLILANARTRDWLVAQEALPPESREALLSQDRNPKLDWRGDALWGTLYDLCHEPEGGGEQAADLRFVLRPQFLLTARHHAVRSARAVHDEVSSGATSRLISGTITCAWASVTGHWSSAGAGSVTEDSGFNGCRN